MIIYSEKIIAFLKLIKRSVKEILVNEVGLRVSGNRFYDHSKRFSYPINIVIYHCKSVLGYFDAPFYEIGINETLMHASHEDLGNVLRHEIAHYLTYIEYGSDILPHGKEFKECCLKFSWGDSVSKATICLELITAKTDEKGAIFRKVQKLMALATSASQNEAETAMIKSQKLLLKHNLQGALNETEEQIFLMRVLMQKRKSAKMVAIGKILETFFVSIVYHKSENGTYLEVIGDKVNVEITSYVAKVLENELENLWKKATSSTSLSGTLAKNSFFRGVAIGYCNKIDAFKKELSKETTNALMVIEKKLSRAKEMIYKRLSTSSHFAKDSIEASLLGQKMGKKLNIYPSIKKESILRKLLPKL